MFTFFLRVITWHVSFWILFTAKNTVIFHLILWCWNFVERHSFRIVSGSVIMRRVLYRQQFCLVFFQKWRVILGIFENFLSLLKFPEFMFLCFKTCLLPHTFSRWVLSSSTATTKPLCRIKFMPPPFKASPVTAYHDYF